MDAALEACRSLHARFVEANSDYVSLRSVGVIALALERNFVEAELRAIISKLGRARDGALDLTGLCEVVSYVMKGAPHTHDTPTRNDYAVRCLCVTSPKNLHNYTIYNNHKPLLQPRLRSTTTHDARSRDRSMRRCEARLRATARR